MKHRSRLEIAAEMLRYAIAGEKKTRLMYRANLSYDVLSDYLAHLISRGLLVFDKVDNVYKTTPKGKKFLAKYKKLSI